MNENISVIVIGGGPGGYVAAIKAAQLGASVTLVEKRRLGGTCLNVGCIPTKSLLHAADVLESVKNAAASGILAGEPQFDWNKIQENRVNVVSQMVKGVESLVKSNKITVVEGAGSFVDGKTVKVTAADGTEQTLTADRIIIAAGSHSSLPRGIMAEHASDPACMDSTGALELTEVPRRLVVIGGGVIGVELASVYNAFGSEVTILCSPRRSHILPGLDEDLTIRLERQLKGKGVTVLPKADVTAFEHSDDGVVLSGKTGEKDFSIVCDKVLLASGRSPSIDGLGLENAGIENERGRILVNDKMETNVEGVYAIGDCLGKVMLAHTASAQGEVAAENAMGGDVAYDGTSCPSCVYTDPELAGVGLTEAAAMEKGYDVGVGKFSLMANGKAVIINGGTGMVKAVIDSATKKILGIHMLGARATDIISECAVLVGTGATVDDVDRIIHAHPTVAEAVKEAVLAADGRAIHTVNRKKK